ncbi:DddA-like double-stranded DNA deaminase toxin [Dactylosporangium siamense]|uniref:DddA-like double-stranded DNA deaminase toxin n=1 Tax=Dactylosporangium siamense TaxID=685454 RepID=UPI0035711740
MAEAARGVLRGVPLDGASAVHRVDPVSGSRPRHVNVVINSSAGVCPTGGFPHGCVPNIAELLPRRSSMTIWHSGPNRPLGPRIWGRS